MMTQASIKIEVGVTTFRSILADSKPLWKVIRKSGRDTWIAKVQPENHKLPNGTVLQGDWVGTEQAFRGIDIRSAISREQFFQNSFDASDDWYQKQSLGTIVHYNNSGKSFIRCEVVEMAYDGKIQKCLMPIALVGDWFPFDLPRRSVDGSINLGYHSKMIVEKSPFRPHYGNIYEVNQGKHVVNPATMPEINLAIPDMTAEEQATAKLWQHLNKIRKILDDGKDAIQMLDDISAVITAHRFNIIEETPIENIVRVKDCH